MNWTVVIFGGVGRSLVVLLFCACKEGLHWAGDAGESAGRLE